MILSFVGLASLKRLLLFFFQCSSCRRAMVNKLWCQEIWRRWQQQKQEPPHARLLTEPKCQQHVATWYLLYRWIIFLFWGSFTICSLFQFGSYDPLLMLDKWFIYLTSWDLLLGFVQAFIAGILVSKRWRLQKISGFDPCGLKLGSIERFYWFLYVLTTNMAIGVTICYWVAVYKPDHQLDPLNMMQHVCNSILMLIDFFITNIPFRFRDFWWFLSVVVFYLIFSVIYYVAGGLDKHDRHYIYEKLNWKEPTNTFLACAVGLVFVTVLHCAICILAEFKNRFYQRITERLESNRNKKDVHNKPLSEKKMEVV